ARNAHGKLNLHGVWVVMYHHRDRAREITDGKRCWRRSSHNCGRLEGDQFSCEFGQARRGSVGEPQLKSDVASFRITEIPHSEPKSLDVLRCCRRGEWRQDANNGKDPLLRLRRERPRRRRTTEQRYELAASHCPMPPCSRPKG